MGKIKVAKQEGEGPATIGKVPVTGTAPCTCCYCLMKAEDTMLCGPSCGTGRRAGRATGFGGQECTWIKGKDGEQMRTVNSRVEATEWSVCEGQWSVDHG